MIQRINLVEKQVLSFTYETLSRICMVVVLINVLLVGFQYVQVMRLKPKISGQQTRLDELNAENTQLTKQPTKAKKKKVSIGEYQQLFDALDALPTWSKLLKNISGNLPNSVWLLSFKSTGGAPVQPKKKGDEDPAEDDAPPPLPIVKIELGGKATDVRAIAEFVAKLDKEPSFANLTLVNSARDPEGFSFTLQGEVVIDGSR